MRIGPMELGVVLLLVLILFGAGRLPDVLGQFGKAMRAFRDSQRDPDPPLDTTAERRSLDETRRTAEVPEPQRDTTRQG